MASTGCEPQPPPAATRRRALDARLHDDRGTITAEFAIVVPVALVILGLAIAAILVSAHRLSLTALALEVARFEARGDAEAAAARLASFGREVAVVRSRDGLLVCVSLSSRPGAGPFEAIEITARGCAASGEGSP